MVADCHTCGAPLDDQDILNAGMECICYQCWEKREKMSHKEWKKYVASLNKQNNQFYKGKYERFRKTKQETKKSAQTSARIHEHKPQSYEVRQQRA